MPVELFDVWYVIFDVWYVFTNSTYHQIILKIEQLTVE